MALKEAKVRIMCQTMEEARKKFPFFEKYISKCKEADGAEPEFYFELDSHMGSMLKEPNLIYPVGDPIFIHIRRRKGEQMQYLVVQPEIDDEDQKVFDGIQDGMLKYATYEDIPNDLDKMKPVLESLYKRVVGIGSKVSMGGGLNPKITVPKEKFELFLYYIVRNRIGYGRMQPMLDDPYLEDIHCTGVGAVKAIHKVFGMIFSDIIFTDDLDLNTYFVETTERVERPVNDAKSIVDAIMPDGSRANFIYGKDVSLEGSSFTLRKFKDVPVSITQVINWGTMSPDLAAYLWLCLENGMNMFVCGETASGKTTTLNAVCCFIKPDGKVYTVENTPEVTMPHDVWQHLLTREGGGKSSNVGYIDLLVAALRSRPDYIIVGEIRAEEGNVAFQAMQTGHPVMATFHAGNVTTLIQRLTGHPINVPISFIDNLNIVLIQSAVVRKKQRLRRVMSVTELERYYEPAKKMITRQVFDWDAIADAHNFRGNYNSFLLEEKVARMLGYDNSRDIYPELERRSKILQLMIKHQIFDYYDVWKTLVAYYMDGESALPFNPDEDL